MVARPVTDDERAQVRRLHSLGKGRNEIARTLKRSGRTISELAAELGLSFARGPEVAAATAAIQMDNKAKRAALIARYYTHANKPLDRLERDTHKVTEASLGKPVTYEVDELPAQDVKALIQASTAASSQAAKLEALDGDTGAEAARSMLGALADGIRRIAGTGEDDAEEG